MLSHWSYVFLALTHLHVAGCIRLILHTWLWHWKSWVRWPMSDEMFSTITPWCWGVSLRPFVRPSIPHPVSALQHLQFWLDPFHIYTSYQAISEAVSRLKFEIWIFGNFLKCVTLTLSCFDLLSEEGGVWESRCSNCSSYVSAVGSWNPIDLYNSIPMTAQFLFVHCECKSMEGSCQEHACSVI